MTADWTQGYVTDAIYTDGFYRELSPAWLNYVAALRGCLPIPLDRPFTYLELGCGLGRSTTILAGAFPDARFIGIDFNPAHIALARRYAEALGIGNVEFQEKSFTEIEAGDLPLCDFIVLHGVYSWVGAEARAGIRRILRDHLKPGGLVYVSYNALPGWAAASPLRKLMVEASAEVGSDAAGSVAPAIALMEEAGGGNSAYFKANSSAVSELKNLKARGPNYLAHEFLNAAWSLFYSVDVADEMAEAKLTYLGAATLSENHIELLVDDATAALIQKQKSPRLRQLLLDYAVNQRFRRDVFVRGHQELSDSERDAVFAAIPLGTLRQESEFTASAKVGNREVRFAEKLFPLVKAAAFTGAKTVGELRQACAEVTPRKASIDNLLTTLVAAGHLTPFAKVLSPQAEKHTKAASAIDRVNEAILGHTLSTRSRQHLISKVTGSGVSSDPLEAVILRLILSGKSAKAVAKALPGALAEYGLKMVRQAQGAKSEAEEGQIATELVDRFLRAKLPVLKCAGILDAC
jgi:SAM-dependent methyltransferase